MEIEQLQTQFDIKKRTTIILRTKPYATELSNTATFLATQGSLFIWQRMQNFQLKE